jgi:hypothetical protein
MPRLAALRRARAGAAVGGHRLQSAQLLDAQGNGDEAIAVLEQATAMPSIALRMWLWPNCCCGDAHASPI